MRFLTSARLLPLLLAMLIAMVYVTKFNYVFENEIGAQNEGIEMKYDKLYLEVDKLKKEMQQLHINVDAASGTLLQLQKERKSIKESKDVEIKKNDDVDERSKMGLPTYEQTSTESLETTALPITTQPKKSEPACKIPQIDPFSPVVMKYVTKQSKTQCTGVTVSRIENGVLKFDLKKVKSIVLIHVQRKHDFWVNFDEWVSFTKRTEKLPIEKAIGRIGCLLTSSNSYVDFTLRANGRHCAIPYFIEFTLDGRLRNIENKQCLSFSGSANGKLSENCTGAHSEFQLNETGVIIHKPTGMCLSYASVAQEEPEKSKIVLSKDCISENARFSFVEPQEDDVKGRFKVTHDCMKLMVLFSNNTLHVDFHLHATPIPTEELPVPKLDNITRSLQSNIAIVLFDSQSNANFHRHMPKTMKFLQSDERSLVFKANTIVGDGTTPQVVAMLTGLKMTDLPEGRRSMSNSQSIDDWPFIFKELHDNGYMTLMAEDDPLLGAFNLRLWGFREPPNTHYGRPFWIAAMAQDPSYIQPVSCIGDKFLHKINMDYLMSSHKVNRDRKKFSFILASHLCHDDFNGIQHADDDVVEMLGQTRKNGLLNDTILIILGDHGSRYGELRETIQGKIEERLPFLSVTLPDRMLRNFPEIAKNLKRNSELLTSYFDLHATFKHILSYPSLPAGVKYGASLFTQLNETERLCENMGVDDRWCPCINFEELNASDPFSQKLANTAVSYINELLSKSKSSKKLCSQLNLDNVIDARKKQPNKSVQKFLWAGSDSKCATCAVQESETSTFKDNIYEVTFKVSPSGGLFEATLHVYNNGLIHVYSDISRTNKYGTQADCIQKESPHLRKYCYCKST